MTEWTSRKTNWSIRFALLIASLLFLTHFGLIYLIQDLNARQMVTDISVTLINLLATIGLLIGAVQTTQKSKQLGLAWIILTIAQFTYFLGDVSWTVLEVWLKIEPYPSIADFFYLIYYPIFFVSLVLMADKPKNWAGWVRKILDSGMVIITSALVFWNFIIGPYTAGQQSEPWVEVVLSLAYPVGDLMILWGLLVLLYNDDDQPSVRRPPMSIVYLGVSGLLMITTDFVFSIQNLIDSYTSGSYIDLGWIAAYLLIGLAGFIQAASMLPAEKRLDKASQFPQVLVIHERVLNFLPYSALVCAFALLLFRHYVPMPMDFSMMAVWVSLLIGMVLVRQVMALAENRRLLDELHAALEQVKQQSVEMEHANLRLQEEVIERKRVERQLVHDALHDSLTGLPNRALFLDRLEQAINHAKSNPNYQFAFLFLDLDHFKVVNDSLGHAAGDQLLITIARRLSETLRVNDTVGRFGGDEFVILLDDVRSEAALIHTLEKIQKIIKVPFSLGERLMFTSASIGVVANPMGYSTPEEIMRDADTAMYHAKEKGKACYTIYSPELGTRARMRLELENELHCAIEEQEFLLYYQPIYQLDSVELAGFEALIRWRHPHLGIILPDKFIRLTEETGLILPIGDWVLRQACMQMHRWHELFPESKELSVSVNISTKQFAQPDFVERVAQILHETGLDPHTLKLEVTENVIIQNPLFAKDVFNRLSQLGIQLLIDDFGTGYSSLSYLQKYPFHSIKIDHSFIQTISQSHKNTSLVRTMIRMAHDLGMEAVAEGIETEEQRAFLQGLECHYGQGYLMSRPLDEQAAGRLIYESARSKAALLQV